mmetsp:Transcript_58674/g.163745  ORF Transcript_58674/g.163745 Transcript_58674/m.163745 type:complete len:212 (+) Transcript_58674:1278-1913(+)
MHFTKSARSITRDAGKSCCANWKGRRRCWRIRSVSSASVATSSLTLLWRKWKKRSGARVSNPSAAATPRSRQGVPPSIRPMRTRTRRTGAHLLASSSISSRCHFARGRKKRPTTSRPNTVSSEISSKPCGILRKAICGCGTSRTSRQPTRSTRKFGRRVAWHGCPQRIANETSALPKSCSTSSGSAVSASEWTRIGPWARYKTCGSELCNS